MFPRSSSSKDVVDLAHPPGRMARTVDDGVMVSSVNDARVSGVQRVTVF